MASDAVEVVHDVSACVMVDIVVVVTSRVMEIGVGSGCRSGINAAGDVLNTRGLPISVLRRL